MEPSLATEAPVVRRRGESPGAARRRREMHLFRRHAETRSPELREKLIERFLPLARSLAGRYRRRTEAFEDVVQVANLGLVKAIDGFDPDRGKPFTAYAVPTILGEVRRHFRDHVWNIRLPRGLQELTMKLDTATDELVEELGQFPTSAQLAERMCVSEEDVLRGLEAAHARRTSSLDTAPPQLDGSGMPVIETIGGDDLAYDRIEAQVASQRAGLEERERRVLWMRFEQGLTQYEIGQELGCSQMQVSRVSRSGLWKLLQAVRGGPEDAAAQQPPMSRHRSPPLEEATRARAMTDDEES